MENESNQGQANAPLPVRVVIVGFGLPGRFVAEVLDSKKVGYCIIERNPSNARGISASRRRVIVGDALDENILRAAGVQSAEAVALTIPDEKAVLDLLKLVRSLNPNIKMLARCNYTSTGIKAERAGAFAVVVEEEIAALEFARLIKEVV